MQHKSPRNFFYNLLSRWGGGSFCFASALEGLECLLGSLFQVNQCLSFPAHRRAGLGCPSTSTPASLLLPRPPRAAFPFLLSNPHVCAACPSRLDPCAERGRPWATQRAHAQPVARHPDLWRSARLHDVGSLSYPKFKRTPAGWEQADSECRGSQDSERAGRATGTWLVLHTLSLVSSHNTAGVLAPHFTGGESEARKSPVTPSGL